MSTETLTYLRENTLIGFTDKRGNAWHAHRGVDGDNPNHFAGPIPIEAVRKLMSYELVEGTVYSTVLTNDGVLTIEDPNRKAIIRLDTREVFNITSMQYQIHKPEQWLVDNLDLLLDGGLELGSAGRLKGGRQAWVQAELPDTREAPGGVKHRPFLTAATSHDGSLATTYLRGTTVVVCDNTMRVAFAAKDTLKVKIRHSRNSLNRVAEVRERLDLVVEQIGDTFDAQVKELTGQHVSDSVWKTFVQMHTNPNKRELEGRSKTMSENKERELNALWNYDQRVAPWKNTAWGVVAAINTYSHHIMSVKGAERPERNQARAISGEFDKLDETTLKLLAIAGR